VRSESTPRPAPRKRRACSFLRTSNNRSGAFGRRFSLGHTITVGMERTKIVHANPEILGGTPVFVGTRVPVEILLAIWRKGETLEEFLDNYPTVSREQAVGLLEEAGRALLAQIS